ncbi:MAG: hypothetical protein ACE5Q3_00810 [Alphaproteobacteria bacterium]
MDLRLCFENKTGVNIDRADVFRHYAENYLSGFEIAWAGSIAVSRGDKNTDTMEPLWQYLIRDASEACRDYLTEYLGRNPMCGYYVHVFEKHRGLNEAKIY